MVWDDENAPLAPWICYISRISTRFVGDTMARLGFGRGQFFLLSELYAEEGLSQDELSRRVGVDKSNTSRSLAKLEQFGLVRRESDPENHRVKRVFLNPKAHEIRKKFRKVQRQWNRELLKGFDPEEKALLIASLKKAAANAEAAISQTPRKMTACRSSRAA